MKDQCNLDDVCLSENDSSSESTEAAIKALMAGETQSAKQSEFSSHPGSNAHRRAPRRRFSVKLPRFRATLRQVALAAGVFVMIVKPWLLPCVLVLLLATLLVSYWTLGHDRFVEIAARVMGVLKKYRPGMATRLEEYARAALRRLHAFVDMLPEKWTDGLYLPDLEPAPELPEKMKRDPFDKLVSD